MRNSELVGREEGEEREIKKRERRGLEKERERGGSRERESEREEVTYPRGTSRETSPH